LLPTLHTQDQQLLLRDAHVTLISTMEHLVVANLLAGFKSKALQLLQRVFHMQVDALGPDDPQCEVTRHKILVLESDDNENSTVPTMDESRGVLPILKTSPESGDSPNTSMLKVWRAQNGI
jgi:hypothetical protein